VNAHSEPKVVPFPAIRPDAPDQPSEPSKALVSLGTYHRDDAGERWFMYGMASLAVFVIVLLITALALYP
jgi:hypothetical protein